MAASVIRAALTGGLLLTAAFANGAEVPPPAYQLIALPAGVPSEVLYSVALQESGTRLCDTQRCLQSVDDRPSDRRPK